MNATYLQGYVNGAKQSVSGIWLESEASAVNGVATVITCSEIIRQCTLNETRHISRLTNFKLRKKIRFTPFRLRI